MFTSWLHVFNTRSSCCGSVAPQRPALLEELHPLSAKKGILFQARPGAVIRPMSQPSRSKATDELTKFIHVSYLFNSPRDATDPTQNQIPIHQQISANMWKLTQATKSFHQSLSMHHGQPKSHFISTCPELEVLWSPFLGKTHQYCLYPTLLWLYLSLPSLAHLDPAVWLVMSPVTSNPIWRTKTANFRSSFRIF